MMASPSLPEGFDIKDVIFSKLYKCVNQAGEEVLCHIAKEAYSRLSVASDNGCKHLEDYCAANNIPVDVSALQGLMNCNIMTQTFDISAANYILKNVCVGFYDALKEKCKANLRELVKMRNKVCHKYGCDETFMQENLLKLKSLITKIYKDIAKNTGEDYAKEEKCALDMIDEIASTDLQNDSNNGIESFKQSLRFQFISNSRDHLANAYSMLTVLNPCTWLGEIDYTILNQDFDASKRSRIDRFKVNQIFTPLKTKDNRGNVEVNQLLAVTKKIRGKETLPQVLLLEGQAGSGKTSLCRFLIHEWCKTIHHSGVGTPVVSLADSNLVILVELRRTRSDTFEEFLCEEILSSVCRTIQRQEWKSILQELDLLIIIDGFDERKDSKLVKDIFANYNKRIVMSTRTKCLEDAELLARGQRIPFLSVSICGFDNTGLEQFVEKVFTAVEDDPNKCQQEINNFNGLINEKKHVVKTKRHLEEYELPLTISFVIILWRDNPAIINELSTSTRLYMEIINLFQKKLKERIYMRYSTRVTNKDIANLVLFLGEIAWKMLKTGEYVLNEELSAYIRKQCQNSKVNYLELLSAFLMCETDLNSDIHTLDFMFLHKTQMEYLAAAYLSHLLTRKETTIEEISKEAKNCEEVLVYLTGCLAIHEHLNATNRYVIVNSFEEKTADFPFWWELYSESLEDWKIGALIVNNKLPKGRWELNDEKVVCGLRFMGTRYKIRLYDLVIDLKRDPNDIPSLQKDMEAVTRDAPIRTEMLLRKQNELETEGTSDKYLTAMARWGILKHFEGSLGEAGCQILPNFRFLVNIRCKLSSPRDVECLSKCLPKLKRPLRRLRVTLDLDPGCTLQPSVDLHPCDNLELSFFNIKNEHKEWLVEEVIRKVTGEDGCGRIELRNSTLEFPALKWIVKKLNGIVMEKLVVETVHDIAGKKDELCKLADYPINFAQD